jgi:hypothetical protein
MTVDAPWCVPNAVTRTALQTRTVKDDIRHYTSQPTPKRRTSVPHGVTRQQQTAKTPVKRPAYQILV